MVKDIIIKDLKKREEILFTNVPEKLSFKILEMLRNWNNTLN